MTSYMENQVDPAADRGATVLLADDDDDIRALVAAALRREGYRVIEACDGAQILDHIGGALLFDDPTRPDIIVSDVRMPGFAGTGILAGLRSSDWDTPFVLMTAYGGEAFEREATLLGADAVFKKPFDVDALLAVVGDLLSPEGARRRRRARESDQAPNER
jgi:DNA-binding response OmpR family regulator